MIGELAWIGSIKGGIFEVVCEVIGTAKITQTGETPALLDLDTPMALLN